MPVYSQWWRRLLAKMHARRESTPFRERGSYFVLLLLLLRFLIKGHMHFNFYLNPWKLCLNHVFKQGFLKHVKHIFLETISKA